MADIRINSLPSTATSFNTDDYIAIDGTSGGTRKMLAATLPLTDVTFGSSGPSAKSSIAARASRQGLVFDGTAGSTVTVSSVGTSDVTVSAFATPTSVSTTGVLVDGPTGMRVVIGTTSGAASVLYTGLVRLTGPATLTAGKSTMVTVTRSGTTLTMYYDGVSVASTTNSDNLGAWNYIGARNDGAQVFAGSLSVQIYNRALSAAEVVALYEAGVPAGADYNTASNTSVVTGFTNGGVSGSNTYGTYSGASATGFTAATTGATGRSISNAFSIVTGNRYRLSFTLTLNSGSAPAFVYLTNGVVDAAGSATPAAVAGSNVIDFTATATTASSVLEFVSTAAGNFAVSSLTLTRIGLLLAPDAGQAGGGLTWYDTSGNAANITLPASGVTWNVPSSRYLGGNWTTSGNLTVSGTGNSSVAGNLGIGETTPLVPLHVKTTGTSTSVFGNVIGTFRSTAATYDISLQFSDGTNQAYIGANSGALTFGAGGSTERARITSSGNFLLGTTTDGGQKLQVAGTAYVSGDATFAGTVTGTQKFVLPFTSSAISLPNGVSLASGYGVGYLNFQNNSAAKIDGYINASILYISNGLVLSSLPTSSAGLPAGSVWNSGGTLKIV